MNLELEEKQQFLNLKTIECNDLLKKTRALHKENVNWHYKLEAQAVNLRQQRFNCSKCSNSSIITILYKKSDNN